MSQVISIREVCQAVFKLIRFVLPDNESTLTRRTFPSLIPNPDILGQNPREKLALTSLEMNNHFTIFIKSFCDEVFNL